MKVISGALLLTALLTGCNTYNGAYQQPNYNYSAYPGYYSQEPTEVGPVDVYGNNYDPKSVTNQYGKYGSPYSTYSATNPYTTRAPKMYDSKGRYRGKLSSNPYDADSVSNPYGKYGSPYSPTSITNPYSSQHEPIYIVPQD